MEMLHSYSLTCSRRSVNISYFNSWEEEAVLSPVAKGQGSVRQQKVDPTVVLGTPACKGSWPLVALARPPAGLLDCSVLISF